MLLGIVDQHLGIGKALFQVEFADAPARTGSVSPKVEHLDRRLGIGLGPVRTERHGERFQVGRRRIDAHLLVFHVDQQTVVAGGRNGPRNGIVLHLHVNEFAIAERSVAVARNDIIGLTLQFDGNLELADAQRTVPRIEVRILDRLFDLRDAAESRTGERHLVGVEDIDLDRGYGHLDGPHLGHFISGTARILRDDAERQRKGLVHGHFPALVGPVVELLGGVAPAEYSVVLARLDGRGRTEVVGQQVQFGLVGDQILIGHRTRRRPVESEDRSRQVVFVQSDLGGGGGQFEGLPDRIAVMLVRVPRTSPLAECHKGQQRYVTCKFHLFHSCFFRVC